jgi:hypothetical protein
MGTIKPTKELEAWKPCARTFRIKHLTKMIIYYASKMSWTNSFIIMKFFLMRTRDYLKK